MRLDQLPGLNTANNLYEVGFGGFVQADNVDISRNGSISRRSGRTRVYAGSIVAGWGDGRDFLFVEGNALKRLNPDYSATVLKAGLRPSPNLHVLRSATNRLYWSTGLDCGVVVRGVNRDWGLPKPAVPRVSQSVVGDLPAGRYLVAAAFVDENGIEGPLSEHVVFTGERGIDFEAFTPTSAQVAGVNIYLSTRNGEELYLALSTGLDGASSYFGDASDFTVQADGLFREPMPIGGQLVEFAGRLWTALGDLLIYSDPFSEMTDLRENFIPVGDRITNFGAVTDGLFVTTETRTYFYAGSDPADMVVQQKAPYGAIPDTIVQVDGRALGGGADTIGLIWASSQGICAGLSGGSMANMTEKQVNNLIGVRGTAFFRETNGQQHYMAVLQN